MRLSEEVYGGAIVNAFLCIQERYPLDSFTDTSFEATDSQLNVIEAQNDEKRTADPASKESEEYVEATTKKDEGENESP